MSFIFSTNKSHFPKIILVAIVFQFLSHVLIAQVNTSAPKQQGLLWEITGKNMKKPSYLYGTMHVSKKLAFHLSDTFFVALKSCDMVALEINPESFMEEILETDMSSIMMNMDSRSYRDFFDKAFNTPRPENKLLSYTLSKDNDFANYLLYRSMYNENFEENTYLDLFIFQAGKKLNKKVFGLETLSQTMELSFLASLPDDKDDEREYDSYNDRQDRHDLLESAYRKGDLETLDSLSKLTMAKKYLKYMINYRNELMAKRMDSLMQKNTLFTGVGAAHLPGEEGVINLLRKKGYTVRAVTGDINQVNSKTKDKIEAMIYKLNYTTQFTNDSLIQINLPGKIVEGASHFPNRPSSSNSLAKEYFYPEMINGSYYRITRINTYAPLEEVSQGYILKRIDSLIFENIPGKILKKKAITQNGYPGYDISNKTKKGDFQRFRIVVTPLEIIVFHLAGTGNFANVEGEKFFGSIAIKHNSNQEWKTYSPKSGGFSIAMPGQMIVENNTNQKSTSRKDFQIQSLDEVNKNYYLFNKATYHDFNYIEEDTFELNYLAKSFYKQFDYKPFYKKFISAGGYPALDLHLKKDKKENIYARLVIVGPSYYLMAVKTSKQEDAEKFFNTFSVKEKMYEKAFVEYYDSTMCFKVKTPLHPYGDSEFGHKMASLYKTGRKNKKEKTYIGKHKDITFNYPPTSEVISVEYEKFHDYKSFASPEKFWESRMKSLTDYESMIVKNKIQEGNKLDLVLLDTNSTRAIKVKLILKEGALYSIFANIDTIGKESAFVKTFFETFQPGDTTIGVSPLINKSSRFFEKLKGSDSASVAEALASINMIKFEDDDAPKLISTYEQFNFSKYLKEPGSIKTNIIRSIGRIHHKSIIPFFEKEYLRAGDSTSIQMAVLKGLAMQKRPEANLSIIKLLKAEVPLSDEREIRNIFYNIQDSLKIAPNLFPGFLHLTRYPEYKNNVYELLARLVDSNYVKPEVYLPFKADLLRDANEELKRRLASEEGKENRSTAVDYEDEYYYDYYQMEHIPKRNFNRESSYKGNLECYSILLLPMYQEANVKSYFNKFNKIKDKNTIMNFSLLMLKNNKEVHDTIWTHFSKNDSYRFELYKKLLELKKLEKFQKTYLTQEWMSKGILYKGYTMNKDSVVFLEKRKVNIKGKEGYVYFFKRKVDKSKNWKLDYVGVQPKDTTQFITSDFTTKKGKNFTNRELQKFMEESIESFEMEGRKRISGSNRRKGTYTYDDFYDF